jgi:hypothetical protein
MNGEPKITPHLFEFLSFEEWKLCFSIAFLEASDLFEASYEIHRYPTPGQEGPTNDFTELFKRAIRFLSFEHGFRFDALEVHRDGRLTSSGPICPGNAAFFVLLKDKGLPNLPLAFSVAIELAQERATSLPLEPLREAKLQVDQDRAGALSRADPRAERERARMRRSILDELGYLLPHEFTQ